VPACWIRKVRLSFILHLKRGSRQLGRSSLTLEISAFIKDEKRIPIKILVNLVRDGAVSAQRLLGVFHLLLQLLHVVQHVLQKRPEATINLGLSCGLNMSASRMAHLNLATLLAQCSARL
jgi:hypothetical protein